MGDGDAVCATTSVSVGVVEYRGLRRVCQRWVLERDELGWERGVVCLGSEFDSNRML